MSEALVSRATCPAPFLAQKSTREETIRWLPELPVPSAQPQSYWPSASSGHPPHPPVRLPHRRSTARSGCASPFLCQDQRTWSGASELLATRSLLFSPESEATTAIAVVASSVCRPATVGEPPPQSADQRERLGRLSISRRISGVKMSCMASSILPPGTTMQLGRDMNESCSMDSR